MTSPMPVPLAATISNPERAFPTLTPEQISRMAAHGQRRQATRGEVLVQSGDKGIPLFVVLSGEIHVLQPTDKPPIENLSAFEAAGVYYSATPVEAQLCLNEDVAVVGGGNSAGQAAVFLASTARRVHMLIRGPALTETMSRYLIARIEENPSIVVHPHTQLIALDGSASLDRVRCRDERSGAVETHAIRHVFLMTGAVPNTQWLGECVLLDEKGFIKTGPDLSSAELARAKWPLTRPPFLLESSRPGIFAVGDVRSGNVKRVASAVGEGSIAVAFVHQARRQ